MLTFPNAVTYAVAKPFVGGFDAIQAHLRMAKFFPIGNLPIEHRSGFVDVDEPDLTGFEDLCRWSLGPLVFVGFRTDTKAVDAAVVKMLAKAAVREMGLTGRAAQLAEKDAAVQVREDLLRRALPKMQVTPILWDTDTNQVFIGSASEKVVLAVLKALSVFDVHLVPPADWLADQDAAWLNLTGLDSVGQGSHGHLDDGVGPLFLRWLWWLSESAENKLPSVAVGDHTIEWLAQDGIEIQAGGRDKRLTVRAADATQDPVVRVALVDGRSVSALGLHLSRDDVSLATLTLGVDGGGLRISGLKPGIPCGTGDVASRATSIANDLAHLQLALAALLRRFALAEGAPQNRGQAEAALTRFLSGDLRAWVDNQVAAGRLEEDAWT